MQVVVIRASPDRQEVAQAPWKVVAAVGVNGLEQTENDPAVHSDQMEITGDSQKQNGRAHDTHTQKHCLNWRGIFGSQTERG